MQLSYNTKRFYLRVIYFLSFVLIVSISSAQKNYNIDAIIDEYKKDKSLENGNFSYCLLNAQTTELISDFNSKTLLIPASTLKVITTSAALAILGKDFKYETKIAYTGSLDSITGVLKGNLIIIGSGDPTLNSEYFNSLSTNKNVVIDWAKKIKSLGIKKINGNIIADISSFENNLPDNWIWGDIGNYFGCIASGLSYKDNKIKLYFKTGEKNGDSTLIIKSIPFNPQLTYINKVKTGGSGDNSISYGSIYQNTRWLNGYLPSNKNNYEVEISMPDPAWQCTYELKQALINEGIKTESNLIVSEQKINSHQVLFIHQSPTLSDIIYQTNIHSNNLFAESLLKTIALKKIGFGSSKDGIKLVSDFWEQRGLNTKELFMTDGSGLSRSNTVSTSYLAKLLSKIYKDKNLYDIINNSFPVAGKNSSLANLCKGTFAENNLRAKSGYINRARGYVGYVKSKSGKDLCFAVLFNNYNCTASEAKQKIEKLLIAFSEL
jgi:D-alanyl-D-alanine carboxypeptidase/D-alanyl-D-alanine-endopeptidase (penicillin-binding protein 4)